MNRRMVNTTAGGAFVWIFVSLGLLTSAFASLDFFADPGYRDPTSVWLFEGGMLSACVGLWVQAKHNLYRVSLYLLVVSSMAALVSGAVVVFAAEWQPIAAMVCVLTTASAMGCLFQVLRLEDRSVGRARLSMAG